jgi:hypothetical protein
MLPGTPAAERVAPVCALAGPRPEGRKPTRAGPHAWSQEAGWLRGGVVWVGMRTGCPLDQGAPEPAGSSTGPALAYRIPEKAVPKRWRWTLGPGCYPKGYLLVIQGLHFRMIVSVKILQAGIFLSGFSEFSVVNLPCMPRLMSVVKHSAFILTGVSIGAALWKTRSVATSSPDGQPLNESLDDLKARLAALETVENRHTAVEGNLSGDSAHALAAIAALESSVATLATRYEGRLAEVESRVGDHEVKLGDHAAKLKEMPMLAQVVSTMDWTTSFLSK